MDTKSLTRRILAITITTVGIGVMAYLSINGNEVAHGFLASSVGLVTGFYFGVKK